MKFDFLSKKKKSLYIEKASILVEALPYIREHSGKVVVIKYGGNAMINKELAESFSRDIGLLKEVGINPIIVHGGGPQISKALKKKKINSEFIDGLRITNKKTIKVVKDVLFNDINLNIVNSITNTGGRCIGLSGHKQNLIEAKKISINKKKHGLDNSLDIGFVGTPINLNLKLIKNCIKKGLIPIISPLGKDKKNNIYNINADTVAGFIAGRMKASKLLLLTDVSGIMDEKNNLISSISIKKTKNIVTKKFIHGGMQPKIKTCISAIEKGVDEATILDGRIAHSIILELFTEHGLGTQIYS